MRNLVFYCFICLTATAQNALAQEPVVVEGVVLESGNNRPVPSVLITLSSSESRMPARALSNEAGRFRFVGVPPGQYSISTIKEGFTRGRLSPKKSGVGGSLTLEAGDHLKDIVLRVSATGVILGTVLDAKGEPMQNAEVTALRAQYVNGRKKWARVANLREAITNNAGVFRMFNLDPGQYRLVFAPPPYAYALNPSNGVVIPVYYPGTTDPNQALTVTVRSKEDSRLTPVKLAAEETMTVRARLINRTNDTMPGGRYYDFRLRGAPPDDLHSEIGGHPTEQTMEFPTTRSGTYDIGVGWRTRNGIVWGHTSAVVGNANVDVDLVISAGTRLTGRAVMEASDGAVSPASPIEITLTHYEYSLPATSLRSDRDGSFSVESLPDGRYRMNVTSPPGTYVRSVQQGDRDALSGGVLLPAGPVTITLAFTEASIEGSVRDRQGEKSAQATVLLQTADEVVRVIPADQNGRFKLQGVPPGPYKLYAWSDIETGVYNDPDFLKRFDARAVPVRIEKTGRFSVELTVLDQ